MQHTQSQPNIYLWESQTYTTHFELDPQQEISEDYTENIQPNIYLSQYFNLILITKCLQTLQAFVKICMNSRIWV